MYHLGQRVHINFDSPKRTEEKRVFFIVATSEEVAEFYREDREDVVLVTDNPYHNHQLKKLTAKERVDNYARSSRSKYHISYFFARRVVPIDPCKNENASIRLERIDD